MNIESNAFTGAEAHARAEADKLKDSAEDQRRSDNSHAPWQTALPDIDTTLQMARLMKIVYEMLDPVRLARTGAVLKSLFEVGKEEPDYKARLKEEGGDDMRMWFYKCAAEGTEAAVTFSPKTNRCTVIFRGTEPKLVDVSTSLSFFQTQLAGPEDQSDEHPRCKVHRGFHGQYYGTVTDFYDDVELPDELRSVPEEVNGKVLETALFQKVKMVLDKFPNTKLYATGHSLGGALSVLFGTRFALKHHDCNLQIINFGCPKVGNEAFAELVNTRKNLCVQRVANKRDIVTRIPNFGYDHVGHTISIDSDEGSKTRAYKWHTGLRALTNWNPLLALVRGGIGDHSTDGYLDALHSHKHDGKNSKGEKQWVKVYEDAERN